MASVSHRGRALAALVDPTRRRIVEILSTTAELPAGEDSGVVPSMTRRQSRHLRTLEHTGLLTVRSSPAATGEASDITTRRCVSLAAVDGRRQLGRSAVGAGAGAGEDPHLSHPGPLRRQRRQARVQRRLGGTRIYSMRRPEIARLMTSCWISLVPSKIVWIISGGSALARVCCGVPLSWCDVGRRVGSYFRRPRCSRGRLGTVASVVRRRSDQDLPAVDHRLPSSKPTHASPGPGEEDRQTGSLGLARKALPHRSRIATEDHR